MDNQKIVVGLDIGTTKICVLIGQMNENGKLDIIGIGKNRSEGVVKGMVTNVDKTGSNIIKAIKDAEEMAGEDVMDVNVGIAGHQVRTMLCQGSLMRSSTEDEISVRDVYRLIEEQYRQVIPAGNKIIHVLPQEYVVDNDTRVKDPVGMTGIKLEGNFQLVTSPELAVLNINKSLKKAGRNLVHLLLEPLASSLSVLTDDEKEMGVVLVDIGGGTTDITIFYEGIVRHTAVIPFGGNLITTDINKGLNILESQAEELKINYGTAFIEDVDEDAMVPLPGLRGRPQRSVSAPALASIVHWRMLEILVCIHTEIISSGYESKLGAGVVLTGGGAQLANVDKLCAYVTGLETRIGYPNEYLGRSKSEEVKSPAFATCVGLVLAGFRSFDERENHYAKNVEDLHVGYSNKKPDPNTKKTNGSTPPKEKKDQSWINKMLKRANDFLMEGDQSSKEGY